MTDLAETLFKTLLKSGKIIAVAESCTGGMIAARLTDLPGSSKIFDRGFVTYSNDAKQELLAVDSIDEFGAVSEETALQMAQGALDYSLADIAAACTGIAGPDGGSAEKPVGLVYIAVATEEDSACFKHNFKGDRASIREQTVQATLQHILDLF